MLWTQKSPDMGVKAYGFLAILPHIPPVATYCLLM